MGLVRLATKDEFGGKNKYGGERAVCPKCKKQNSELYEFDKEDWRKLECSECHKESPYPQYFLKSLDEAILEYQKTKGD